MAAAAAAVPSRPSASPPPAAAARGYTYDVPETYPAAFTLWRRQVRGLPLEDRPWARTLQGTAVPVRKAYMAGADYLLGGVCEPHNCGGNEAILMISPDQTRVLGIIRLTGPDRRVVDHLVGSPSALEARCLAFYLENGSDAQRCP
nr:Ivy family c-type lysozyme inhibitor [Brevundimonas lenta]